MRKFLDFYEKWETIADSLFIILLTVALLIGATYSSWVLIIVIVVTFITTLRKLHQVLNKKKINN